MKISVLGFDHGKYDRRVVMKDIAYFVSKGYKVQYLYRESESKDFQKSVPLLDDNVEFVAVPKIGSGLISRKKFEDANIKIAIKFNPDYFYLHGMFVTFPVRRLKQLKKIGKVVYDEHEYSPEPIAINNKILKDSVEFFIKIRDRLVSKYIDNVFTQSESIRTYMQQVGYKNIILKQNVSEAEILKPKQFKDRKKILIIAGSMTYERGPFKILEIVKALVSRIPNIELHLHVMFSNKTLENEVKNRIDILNLESNVLFFDLLPYTEIVKKISTSLIGVMAFPQGLCKITYLSIPNRFYDTLVAGTPLLIDNISLDVNSEVINHNLGVSFEFDNFQKSITDLTNFLTNEDRYNNSLHNIYEYAQKNSWKEISKVLDEVFI